jgi:hypothetical protein
MKTKDLIRELQEADPSGEIEVCVNNVDIFCVTTEPAYWDGRLQLLVRDEKLKPYFDVVGGKYVTSGSKVVIQPMSITDVLWDNPEAPVDYSELGEATEQRYKATDDETRKAARDVELKVDMDAFHRWVEKKTQEIRPGNSDKCRSAADYFYEKNLSPKDPVKDLPPKKEKMGGILGIGAKEYEVWPSWNERREAKWDDDLEVYWRGGWGIRKKGETNGDTYSD